MKNSFVTRTTMTELLSPAAQAVLDAAISVCHPETEVVAFQCTRLEVAAALRAVADQVVPEECAARFPNDSAWQDGFTDANERIRDEILAIAAELEGGND